MREVCKAKLKESEKECNHPIMILKSAPMSEIGTNKVKQITIFGCMNEECTSCGVETSRFEAELETF